MLIKAAFGGLWIGAFFDLLLEGYISLMQLIVPDKGISSGLRTFLEIVIVFFSVSLLVTALLFLIIAAFTDATVWELWRFIFIPLGIIALQIGLGLVARYVIKK